jgi:predicted Rossmann fold flavoprotein
MWEILRKLGHTIVEPVPSLFTLNISHPILDGLAGISMPGAIVSACGYKTTGPILITHWGLSGPAILKLSAFAAREWHEMGYRTTLKVNWTGRSIDEQFEILRSMRDEFAKKMAVNVPPAGIPSKWWIAILQYCGIDKKWSDLSNRDLQSVTDVLCNSELQVEGKSTFKEEFVTAGGVKLSEVNFKTMESKLLPGLFFAGEVLDIDAVTGGFNFQAAWTTSFIAASHLAQQIA